jgi:AmmeMemoRadiSam system protein A
MSAVPPVLTDAQRQALLALARQSIRERVRGARPSSPLPADPALQAPGAAFVTITREGELRGCIGFIEAVRPLADAVAHCAASAAVADPRFPAVTAAELPHLRIEISVLSPMQAIEDPQAVTVGLHGLLVSHAGRQGLLLPQVATELGWDRQTFLRQTCHKAGLAADAWQHGARLYVFTVDHFTDELPVEADPGGSA